MNAKTKYTPGPWEWWTSNSHKRLSASGRDGSVLHAYNARDGFPCIGVSDADACLIAAAPDLLEAVRNQSKFHSLQAKHDYARAREDHAYADSLIPEMNRLDTQIEAAITKATGAAS